MVNVTAKDNQSGGVAAIACLGRGGAGDARGHVASTADPFLCGRSSRLPNRESITRRPEVLSILSIPAMTAWQVQTRLLSHMEMLYLQ